MVITNELLDFFAVDVVAVGLHSDDNPGTKHDPFAIPRERGIFRKVDSGSDVTTRQVIKRIISNSAYASRNRLKETREAEAISRSSANNSVALPLQKMGVRDSFLNTLIILNACFGEIGWGDFMEYRVVVDPQVFPDSRTKRGNMI
ncbi:unnamed protein product [Rodentolepis nana]|uniref:Uncharacterized protein n=1 Tax=Rodentolepis nana TaxID=102285 RepID=A0A3P7RUJ1_RODNA|nr:unnamed protein product [Rodentolepis nana]